MFHLKSVEIDGFWGKWCLNTDFFDDTTIFIGNNGTGKTTLINIIQSVLTVDLEMLWTLDFKKAKFILFNKKLKRTISIEKKQDRYYNEIVLYKISNRSYEFPLLASSDARQRRRLNSRHEEALSELKEELSNIACVSWLSVHREMADKEVEQNRFYYNKQSSTSGINPIDMRLKGLMDRLTRYLFELQSKSGRLSIKFQRDVLATMLFNEEFDTFNLEDASQFDLESLKEKLTGAYSELGVKGDEINKKIHVHIKKIGESIETLKNPSESNTYYVKDVMPLSSYYRTRHIVDLSTKLESLKQKIFNPVDVFIKILRDFISDKNFELKPAREGSLVVSKNNEPINIQDLSSGEKQIMILLTETLLQRGRKYILIADEPELSLHVTWQRKLLGAIRTINNNTQIVVATHSPEIAGRWPEKIVNMEGLLDVRS